MKVLKFVGCNKHIASLFYATNSEGCNSIQYAAKSGNLKVFKYLCYKVWLFIIYQGVIIPPLTILTSFTLSVDTQSWYVCQNSRHISWPDKRNNRERGWNAALFITDKAGAERERINILHFLEKRKLNVYHVTRSRKTIS